LIKLGRAASDFSIFSSKSIGSRGFPLIEGTPGGGLRAAFNGLK
jgi:hypothetical protein